MATVATRRRGARVIIPNGTPHRTSRVVTSCIHFLAPALGDKAQPCLLNAELLICEYPSDVAAIAAETERCFRVFYGDVDVTIARRLSRFVAIQCAPGNSSDNVVCHQVTTVYS